ncbi:MAG: alpha/beta hydrolase [Candidatus Nanopelagicales bacterium]
MVGRRDVITPPANSRALAGLLPNSQLLRVPAAGHSVLFQAPQESATAITAFLDGTSASPVWPCT